MTIFEVAVASTSCCTRYSSRSGEADCAAMVQMESLHRQSNVLIYRRPHILCKQAGSMYGHRVTYSFSPKVDEGT